MKNEMVHQTRFRTLQYARRALFRSIEVVYNRQRRHSGVGYLTPAQAYKQMAATA